MYNQKDIGRKIKEKRKKSGLKTIPFAKSVGISQSYLSEIESGIKIPKLDVFIKIIIELGITVSEFFRELENESK